MFKILGYGLKCLGKAMKTPQLKGTIKSYAFVKCSQKGLDPAMIELYKDTVKDGITFTIYSIKNLIA